LIALLILVPFLSIILLNLPLENITKKIAFWWVLALAILQVIMVLFPNAGFWFNTMGTFSTILRLDLWVDNLTLVMLLSIGIVLLATLLVGRSLISDEDKQFNFVNLILAVGAGMNGIVMVRDIFSLYVFLEITAVASFILIASSRDVLGLEGAFKYIILSAVASTMMLASIAILVMLSGSTAFSAISYALKSSPHSFLIHLAMALFIGGLFVKAGLMPFHGWVPDAYTAAPAPVSILLAGIATKTIGVYTLIRIVMSVFGFAEPIKNILLFIGAVSIVLGALAALGQNDFKRMLAYSSISQVGYIILGLGSGTPLGVAGAVFHLFNHAVFKSLLFVNAAAVEEQAGTRNMNEMSGFGSKMPLTGLTSVLASLSTAGIPPLSGFWSKLIIIMALWLAGYHVYAVIAILASVVTLAYFLSLQRRVFFGKIKEEFNDLKEAGLGLSTAALLLAVIIVEVGVLFPLILDTFILPIRSLVGG
jgi:multicomponent Na+:H+ antiporter subunit D